jgi:prepilin-type N-terminal cleavage/methylation domain-containing protein
MALAFKKPRELGAHFFIIVLGPSPNRKEAAMHKKGFTLVELMVVVAIIIILAAILVPRYLDVTDQAKASKCMANQRTVEGAAAVYMADHEGTPATAMTDLTPDYIPDVPTCPSSGNYTFNGNNGSCVCDVGSHQRSY